MIVSALYPPCVGGVADHTYHLAHALARSGHHVTVVTSTSIFGAPPAVGEAKREPEAVGADVAVLRLVRHWNGSGLLALALAARRAVPEVVIVQYVPHMYGRAGVAPGAAMIPWLLRIATGAVVVGCLHELAVSWSTRPGQTVLAAMHRLQLVLLSAGCRRLVTTNALYASRLGIWLRRQVHVIPVGATILPVSLEAAGRAVARQRLAAGGEMLLGELSPLSVGKRPLDLVDLLDLVSPRPRLVLLGEAAHNLAHSRAAVMSYATQVGVADRITWTSYLPSVTLSACLGTLNAYIHTQEVGASTRSTSLCTALAHGLPVIAYRGRETSDLFVDGCNILLAPLGDTNQLADRVRSVLTSSEVSGRLSRGATELFARHFTWSAIAKQFLETTV